VVDKKQRRPAQVSVEDAAYSAGIMDGEGSVSLTVNRNVTTRTGRTAVAPMLIIQVSSTCREVLDWLQLTWGVGSVIVTYRPRRPNHRTAYVWRVRGQAASEMLTQMLPYLRIKRAQAELGIYAQSLVVPCKKLGDEAMAERLKLREEMLKLNRTTSRPRLHFYVDSVLVSS